jgi:thymidylate kinase
MQIELIGCTSAGKSTLTQQIVRACEEQGIEICPRDDFVLKQMGLNWIKGHLPRTLLVDLAALFACLVTWQNNYKFYLFTTQLLFQLPTPRLEKLNLFRNVLKKIGIYEIIRFRRNGQQVILVDEGVLQAAHNLFVHVSVEVKTEHLTTFAGLVPLPDVVVYLKQPEALLIDRVMKRGHNRIPDRTYGQVSRFVKRAVVTFDQLAQHPAVEHKVLIINGDQDVILATNDQADPMMDLALKIMRSGFSNNRSLTPTEPALAPGL